MDDDEGEDGENDGAVVVVSSGGDVGPFSALSWLFFSLNGNSGVVSELS